MSQARDSEEIRRAIPGLFACDLAGQTNFGSHYTREETFRCVAVVNSATRPLTLLEKNYLEKKVPGNTPLKERNPRVQGNLGDLPIDEG